MISARPCRALHIRWRCSKEDECGEITFYFIGGPGEAYAANPGYNPDDDDTCKCWKKIINPD